jgi:D-alanyl-lipoteichoic acid acyltransferase DltB (MBOAT superfamily)
MRSAQRIAAGIYLLFVVLMVPLLYGNGGVAVEETAIIDLAVQVASILGPLLLLAAIMSQFSAAVADTLGAGGLAGELIPGRGRERYSYLVFTAAAVVLVWLSDVFELISLASRAFALYYLVQCLLALRVMQAREQQRSLAYWATVALALVMGFVVLFALPVESL